MIDDPDLLARLRLDDEAFRRYLLETIAPNFPSRELDEAAVQLGLGYPWTRPAEAYGLVGGEVVAPDPALAEGRHPVLAVGSNAAPGRLRAKFAHLQERDVLVVTGELHDLDVGAVPTITVYGSVPATVFASPGTAVRAAVLWLTHEQLTALTWTELTYALVRLDARFTADDPALPAADPWAYVNRFGVLHLDGGPVALAAVPARGRTAPARTQRELVEALGALLHGRALPAEEVLRAAFADPQAHMHAIAEHVWPLGHPLDPGLERASAA